MRRFGATLAGGFLVIGLLVGPGAGVVAAQATGPTVATGWTCHPDGSGVISSPSTVLSLAITFPGAPWRDSITCFFPNLGRTGLSPGGASGIQSGGDCYYHESQGIGIEFAHRIYVVSGNAASLVCWDGSQVTG